MKESDRYQLWYGGMAGTAFIAVTQMLGRSTLGTAHQVALMCFAIVLPIAVMFVVWPARYSARRAPENLRRRMVAAGVFATVVFCVGTVALFCSFGIRFAVVLAASSFAMAVLGNAITDTIRKKEA